MSDTWICPNCGSEMKKNPELSCYVCVNCGCSIDATDEQIFDTGIICPNCHRIIENETECPYCGYDLGSDFD